MWERAQVGDDERLGWNRSTHTHTHTHPPLTWMSLSDFTTHPPLTWMSLSDFTKKNEAHLIQKLSTKLL